MFTNRHRFSSLAVGATATPAPPAARLALANALPSEIVSDRW
jgi:hypothetical protein